MDMRTVGLGFGFGLLGVLAGGGLYGLYVNHASRIAHGALTAYTLMGECAVLESNPNPSSSDVAVFNENVRSNAPHVFSSLAIAGAISGQTSGSRTLPLDIDELLRQCADRLNSRVSGTHTEALSGAHDGLSNTR